MTYWLSKIELEVCVENVFKIIHERFTRASTFPDSKLSFSRISIRGISVLTKISEVIYARMFTFSLKAEQMKWSRCVVLIRLDAWMCGKCDILLCAHTVAHNSIHIQTYTHICTFILNPYCITSLPSPFFFRFGDRWNKTRTIIYYQRPLCF